MNAHTPYPIDASDVLLPPELLELTEQIAANVHEIWSRQRIADGWRYGKERNDTLKEHPCLVPYKDLPENEKAYDRQTAIETLKVVLQSGFEIRKK